MILRILPHLTLCDAAGQFIFLDVRQDRYLAVPASLDGVFRQWLVAPDAPIPKQIRHLLLRARIFAPSDPEPRLSAWYVPPPEILNLSVAAPRPNSSASVIQVFVAVTGTSLRLRFQRLEIVLANHAAHRILRPLPSSCSLDERVAAFERARRLVPLERNCLLDTLALDRCWDWGKYGCCVVFGVTAAPFAAHCWLQRGSVILNDSADRVSRFTPILMV